MSFIVEQTFRIASRGLVVVTTTPLPSLAVGVPHRVRFTAEDGHVVERDAYVEVFSGRAEARAILVMNVEALAAGTIIELIA